MDIQKLIDEFEQSDADKLTLTQRGNGYFVTVELSRAKDDEQPAQPVGAMPNRSHLNAKPVVLQRKGNVFN